MALAKGATMKFAVLGLLLSLLSTHALAQASVSDKLMTKILSLQMPDILHQQKDQSFELGKYDITVFKASAPTLTSSANSWQLRQPIRVEFIGRVSQNFLGTAVAFNCATEFTSQSLWLITPNIEQGTAKIKIDMPVPETILHCDGLKLPITSVLQHWFNTEKPNWQAQAEQQYQQAMKKVF